MWDIRTGQYLLSGDSLDPVPMHRNGNELIREPDVLEVVKGILDHILDKTTVGCIQTRAETMKLYALAILAGDLMQPLHNFTLRV